MKPLKKPKPPEKYSYIVRILTESLIKEEKFLKLWEKNILSEDPMTKRQAEGNIPSNQHRIKEIKEVMEILNPTLPEEEAK